MNYLVDTHILLWSFLEPPKLSKQITSILLDESNEIYYSPISLWEISIKYGLKKLFLNGGTPDDFFDELDKSYYHCKPINPLSLATNYKLPIRHKDPFDRFLVWEAIRSEFTLLSADEDIELYKQDGLRVVK
jgi:PIN domain nuclease of toxin-antitoxin system